jgi:hypothetical protein
MESRAKPGHVESDEHHRHAGAQAKTELQARDGGKSYEH